MSNDALKMNQAGIQNARKKKGLFELIIIIDM